MESNKAEYDFSLLPPHVIAEIFKFLKFRQRLSAARTCKTWYFASCDPVISKNIRVRLHQKLNHRIDQLHRPFGSLVVNYVTFNEFSNYSEFFAKFGQFIRELVFYNCNLSQQQLFDCLILTTNLVSLSITVNNDLFEKDVNLNDEQMSVVESSLKYLKNFKIVLVSSNCDGLRTMMRMMPNLEKLDFRSDESCECYVYRNLFEYFNMFTEQVNLNCLVIGRLFGTNSVKFFNDFSKITQNLNVDELKLYSIEGITFRDEYSENFDVFCKKLSGVRKLSMQSIGQNQINYITQYMSQLTEIKFTRLVNQNLRPIGNLRNLQKLTLCVSYGHREFEGQLLGMFAKLHQLKELRLDYEVNDEILSEICTACTNLTTLELLSMQTKKLSIVFKNLTKLKRLRLLFWYSQSDYSTIDCDITNLSLLEELEINSFVPGMTIELIEKLPNLRPELLLRIKTTIQTGYVDPELEETLGFVGGLFD